MSLLWSEMTLRSTAILPTVNIIQYHPTGINMVVLLLAEMCCCSSFSARRHFFGTNSFPIREALDDGWWYRLTARKPELGAELRFSGFKGAFSHARVFAGLRCVSIFIPRRHPTFAVFVLQNDQMNKYRGRCMHEVLFLNCIVLGFFYSVLTFCFSSSSPPSPPRLCDWLWWGSVWRELMTGVSRAEMSDQMLSQHDHEPDPCWWIMNTAHLNSNL